MELSEIVNVLLGGGLVATVLALLNVRSTMREAKANAEKATAEAETVRIDNTEKATHILIENIVEPLKEELDETRKSMQLIKREMARLRKAIDTANSCKHHDDCPVLHGLRKSSDGGREPGGAGVGVQNRQHRARDPDGEDGGGSDGTGDADADDGQPP